VVIPQPAGSRSVRGAPGPYPAGTFPLSNPFGPCTVREECACANARAPGTSAQVGTQVRGRG